MDNSLPPPQGGGEAEALCTYRIANMKNKVNLPRPECTLWRIHIRPKGPNNDVKVRESVALCIRKQVIGIGWGFQGETPPSSVKEFYRRASAKFAGKGWKVAANAIINPDGRGMKVDDLVWMRDLDGNYYLGRIRGKWKYDHRGNFGKHDIVNMRSCNLKRVDKRIPGAIINRFVSRQTVCRIHDHDATKTALTFSKLTYNALNKKDYYADTNIKGQSILNLLSPEDLEDAIGLYLQHERNYMLIPSSRSRRNDTLKYEYELIEKHTGKRAFVQVKSNELLNPDDYRDSDGKYYLFSAGGYKREEKNSTVETLQKREIEDFIRKQKRKMPYNIRMWIEYLNNK